MLKYSFYGRCHSFGPSLLNCLQFLSCKLTFALLCSYKEMCNLFVKYSNKAYLGFLTCVFSLRPSLVQSSLNTVTEQRDLFVQWCAVSWVQLAGASVVGGKRIYRHEPPCPAAFHSIDPRKEACQKNGPENQKAIIKVP